MTSTVELLGLTMPEANRLLGMYLHLARASGMRQQPMVRDKLLLLAGVQAEEMGLEPISALCRHRILEHNARHLVREWPTLQGALGDEQFQLYLKQLRRRYSSEKIEHMLATLGIELGREREAYFSDLEYAAALLDTRPETIGDILNSPPKTANGAIAADAEQRPRRRVLSAEQMRDLVVAWAPWAAGLALLAALAAVAGR